MMPDLSQVPICNSYTYNIRLAKDTDLHYLPTVESSAATLFHTDPDLAPIADDEPMTIDQHRERLDSWSDYSLQSETSGTWVAIASLRPQTLGPIPQADELIVGFIVTQPLPLSKPDDQNLGLRSKRFLTHICEISVHADHQRKGLATKLINAVLTFGWSSNQIECKGFSLTTFRDVPFNGPFYARFGFKEVSSDDLAVVGAIAVQIWSNDQDHFASISDGRLGSRRCFMIADL